MELRKVDPRTLKFNPNNPRKIAASEAADAAMIASIKEIGILQPPTVRTLIGLLVLAFSAANVSIRTGDFQGNRVKESGGDKACEEIIVPAGGFALEALRVLAGHFTDEIVCHVL